MPADRDRPPVGDVPPGGEAATPSEPAATAPPDPGPGYEQARDELGEVVRRLESGGVGLEESLRLWERGEHLAEVCQRWLDGARARLEQSGGTGHRDGGD